MHRHYLYNLQGIFHSFCLIGDFMQMINFVSLMKNIIVQMKYSSMRNKLRIINLRSLTETIFCVSFPKVITLHTSKKLPLGWELSPMKSLVKLICLLASEPLIDSTDIQKYTYECERCTSEKVKLNFLWTTFLPVFVNYPFRVRINYMKFRVSILVDFLYLRCVIWHFCLFCLFSINL